MGLWDGLVANRDDQLLDRSSGHGRPEVRYRRYAVIGSVSVSRRDRQRGGRHGDDGSS